MPDGAVIEARLAPLDEQVEMLTSDTVAGPQVALGRVPEGLDAVDGIAVIGGSGLRGFPWTFGGGLAAQCS